MTTRTTTLDHLARPAMAAFVALFLVVVLSGCGGGASASPSAAPPSEAPAAFDDTGALIGAIADVDGSTVTVRGFFLGTPDGAQICALVLESYPPQCGGPTLTVTGEVPQDVLDDLDSTSEPDLATAWWGWVSITGTVSGGAADPTIAIESIELADPAG